MATCSKHEQGYDDNRFEFVVGEEFHCSICLLVLRDPVMCKNQHCYCSSCIKEHLENAKFCPTCREHLSVDILTPAQRIVTEYLSKLNIHCDFYTRGCREVIQLSNLKRHVGCGFSPVQCSNDGCDVLVNERNKFHHEAEVCDFRKSKCHDCSQLKREVKELEDKMLHRQDKVKYEMNEMKIEMKAIKVGISEIKVEMKKIKDEMKEMTDQVLVHQDQLEDKILNEIKEEIKIQMKKGVKEEMKNEIKEIVVKAMRDALAEKKDFKVVRENIIVTGGSHRENANGEQVKNKSTECFNWAIQTWTLLNSAVFEGRSYLCSFLYQGQIVVAGGHFDKAKALICLNVADPAATWKNFGVNLRVKHYGHRVVNYNDRLFISGGWVLTDEGNLDLSDAVDEVQLVPPYSSKTLTRLPQKICNHGMELFDNKLFIFGSYSNGITAISNVVQYDLMKNECKEMPSLPYAVEGMATVLWRNNVVVIGGENEHHTALNAVFMYDVTTGRSQILPSMKRKRHGCTAVLTGNVVVVMGGRVDKRNYLKSVECFDLERQVWRDLPDMLEPRAYATAVVKPNN